MTYTDPGRQREYQRLWVKGRRAAFFADKACAKCGSTDRLELDHINPAEKTSHRIWSWSWKRILAEASKCQVLCADCHQQKTYEQRPVKAEHGSAGMYKRGCRCDLCARYNRDRVRLQRVRQAQRESRRAA